MKKDLTRRSGVKKLMLSSSSEDDWNANCDKVIKANGGYPAFWHGAIIESGINIEVRQKWV